MRIKWESFVHFEGLVVHTFFGSFICINFWKNVVVLLFNNHTKIIVNYRALCTFQLAVGVLLSVPSRSVKMQSRNVLGCPFKTSPHSLCSIIAAISDYWTLICRKPQAAVKVMRLSTVWPQLAPNQTSPVLTLHDPCLWSCLTHRPEWPALPGTNSTVFRDTDGAQSIHRVSRYLADSLDVVWKGEKLRGQAGNKWNSMQGREPQGKTKLLLFFCFFNPFKLPVSYMDLQLQLKLFSLLINLPTFFFLINNPLGHKKIRKLKWAIALSLQWKVIASDVFCPTQGPKSINFKFSIMYKTKTRSQFSRLGTWDHRIFGIFA